MQPCVVSACRYFQHAAHRWDRILKSHILHPRVPGSDSFAKYAAAFFNISRSIFTSANSFFVRASSISISVSGLYVLPILPSLPALCAFTQFPNVDFGNDNCTAACSTDICPSVTSLTASSLNSFVYLPCGIPFFLMLTPPSLLFYSTLVSTFPILPQRSIVVASSA